MGTGKNAVVELDGKRYVIVPEDEYRPTAKSDNLAQRIARARADNAPTVSLNEAFRLFAKTLHDDRRNAGLTQQDLAKASGVRTETISRIELGKVAPRQRTIEALYKAIKRHRVSPA